MKKIIPVILVLSIIICANAGCKSSDGKIILPENFYSLNDTAKLSLLMQTVSPDSLARLVCVEMLKPDSISMFEDFKAVVGYAYINYNDSDKVTFGKEVDAFSSSLPTLQRITLYCLAKGDDPLRLGFRLGKEYVAALKEKTLTTEEINEELYCVKQIKGESFYNKVKKGIEAAFKDANTNLVEINE